MAEIRSNFVCDCCHVLITDPTNGYHIRGNICYADPDFKSGGLVGSGGWIPTSTDTLQFHTISETVLCKICLCEILKIKQEPIPRSSDIQLG